MIRFLAPALLLVVGVPAAASLYQPEEPNAVPVRADGTPEPLAFDDFRQRMVTLANVADARPTAEGKPNRDRARVLERVAEFQRKKEWTTDELAVHAVDLLRLGNTDPRPGDPGLYLDKAINLLAPHSRDRRLNYFLLTVLAEVHLARGEFREAIDTQDIALLDAAMPAKVSGWTAQQREWIAKLDRDYVPHYLAIRRAEMETRKNPEEEDPTPLFPLPKRNEPHSPVRFVNDAVEYEVGTLTAAERAKLPPDAVAIVQQLLLWFPTDTRLYWLLAELYAADGSLDEADTILDQCTWSRQYGNRRILMEHRTAVSAALTARSEAEKQAALDAFPINLRVVWYYFAAVVLIAAVALIRSWTKQRGGGHSCCGS